MAGWVPPLIPGIVLLLADGYRLGRMSLWRDEAYTVDAIGRPLPRLFAMLAHTDAVNGAYYVLMHTWARVAGTSPTALRLPSLLAMAVAAVVTAATGGRLARAGRLPAPALTGVVAGLLFTAAPQVTRYAQDARAYGLVTMCATVATYLLLRALADGRWRWWTAYGAAIIAVGLFSVLAFLLVGAQTAAVLAAQGRRGDAVLYVPPSNRVFSLAHPAPFRRLRDVALAQSPAAAANLSGAEVTAGVLRARFAGVNRVWVVSGHRMFPFPDGGLEPAEAGLQRFSLVRRWDAGAGMLSLYRRRG
jgi:hypothetical protein